MSLARMPVIVRVASKEDIKEIYYLQKYSHVFPVVNAPGVAYSDKSVQFVAIDPRKTGPDKYVGYCAVDISLKIPEIEVISTRYGYSQQNIGSKLMGLAIGTLIKKNFKKVFLRSVQESQDFYSKIGFLFKKEIAGNRRKRLYVFELDLKKIQEKRFPKTPRKIRIGPTGIKAKRIISQIRTRRLITNKIKKLSQKRLTILRRHR
jgi:N-acetylglutamate synthase-like GNAT family acetyltransferase